ncbi:30S ribosomal protein S2 [Candidatus Saccharibacteria bacterium CPR2]|nr:30S ribosomal protein S2 [Candidatus Saccharibacteria bacterium CPR2]
MSNVDIKELFEAGAHFGHTTSRWHPKMAPYIYGKRGNIHVIDLEKTVDCLDRATKFVEKITSEGKQILYVGTKQQVKEIIKGNAESVDMPYVNERWLGGMLTNFKTISSRVKQLKTLESKMESGELAGRYNKLEVQRFGEEIELLNLKFGGIKNMAGLPGAIFVADVVSDEIAVKEAARLGIPVIAIVDTNSNPTLVNYPIPSNDDASKALNLIISSVTKAIENGKHKAKAKPSEKDDDAQPKSKAKPKKTLKSTKE